MSVLKSLSVGVLPHRDRFASYGRNGQEMVVGPLLEALEKEWELPVHFATYTLHGAEQWHRFRKVHATDPEFVGRLHTQMLVMDYDRPKLGNEKNPWNSQDEIDAVLELLADADLWPTVSYVTPHGMRMINVLDEQVPVLEGEHLYRILLDQLAEAGIESDDSTKDWTRVFALPYIRKGYWEDDEKSAWVPGDATWESPFVADSVCYTPEALLPARQLRSRRPQPNLIAIDSAKPDSQEAQALLYGDNARHTQFFKRARELLKHNAFVDIVFGEGTAPFPPGKQNDSIFRMVGSLTLRLWNKIEGMTPEHLYALMAPCLRGLAPDACDVMWEQLCRTWEKLHNSAELQRVSDEETERIMLEGFREQAASEGVMLDRKAAQLEEQPVEFMRRHMILQSGKGAYHLMTPTGYYRTSPVTREGLVTAVMDMGLGNIYGLNASDGAEIPLDALLRRSCSTLARVDGCLGLQRNRGVLRGLEIGDLALDIPTHYLIEHEPLFVRDVDTFLRLLAGADYERLEDWLGHAQDIYNPICALSLSGPSGTGKSLLGDILAARFGPGGKNSESVLTGTWNDGLMRNPVIHADEGISTNSQIKRVDQMLRLIVTGGPMEIRQRRIDSRTVEVYPRLIITANDLEALQTALGNRVMEADSVDAITRRMLHMEAQPDAEGFFASKGGRAMTNNWVKGEALAVRHLAWIYQNRKQPSKYTGDGRLLVEGSTPRHADSGAFTIRQALRENPQRTELMTALCRAVECEARGQKQQAYWIDDGNHQMMTNPNRMHTFMEARAFGTKVMPLHTLSRAMNAVASRGHRPKGGSRVWVVDLPDLMSFAEDIGATDEVLKTITRMMTKAGVLK